MVRLHALGLLEVECDAPPYPIVRACRKLGLLRPEDARWCRLNRRQRAEQGWKSFFASFLWVRFLCGAGSHEKPCSCGCPLLNVGRYSFAFQPGEQLEYELVQCPNCWTIYWEQL
jgi:hypothetical protein